MNNLKKRCQRFLTELEVPLTKFCKKFDICTQTYYRWLKGTQNIKEEKQKEIDEYLKKYNF